MIILGMRMQLRDFIRNYTNSDPSNKDKLGFFQRFKLTHDDIIDVKFNLVFTFLKTLFVLFLLNF